MDAPCRILPKQTKETKETMLQRTTVSPKKRAANRRNALRSTGPRTPAGKRTVALNAVKHGLFAKHVLITAGAGKEDQSEFASLLAGLEEHFQPAGLLESLLVETVAACVWRRRRVLRFETTQIKKQIDRDIDKQLYELERLAKKDAAGGEPPAAAEAAESVSDTPGFPEPATRDRQPLNIPPPCETDTILRYAASLDRELYRALNQLERVQRRRQGESVPAPVNVNM